MKHLLRSGVVAKIHQKKGSHYCTEHNDHATKFRDDEDGAAETTEEIDTVIIKILAERGTRQGKNYEMKYYKINN